MFRYNPAFRFLFAAVRDGWLGQVFEIHGVMSKMVGDQTRRQLAEYGGGSMFELGCHLIDPLLHIMGPPDSITPFNRRTRPEQDNLLDNTMAVFEYARCTATIRSAVVEVDGGRRRQFVVCGDQGTIVIRPLEPPRLELTLAEPRERYQRGTQVVELPESPGRYHGAWVDLARAIRGETTHQFTHDHDLAVQRAILTASGYVI
jgi:predicted dehydrogenase